MTKESPEDPSTLMSAGASGTGIYTVKKLDSYSENSEDCVFALPIINGCEG